MKLKKNPFTYLAQFLILTLPFYVIIKIFFEVKLGIPNFGFFLKEGVVILLIFSLIFEYVKNKKKPILDITDFLIFAYIGYGILITMIGTGGVKAIVFGGRYDFLFFIVFLIFKHGKEYLQVSLKSLMTLFMYSASCALLISLMIKFRFGEESLLLLGFTDYVSNWTYNGSVPIYHGLENSGIRRFSGIMDSPNAMGFFLILYAGIFTFFQKKKGEFYVIVFLCFLAILLFLTYSRSALLGVICAIGIVGLINIKHLCVQYRKEILIALGMLLFAGGCIGLIFQDNVKNIVFRTSSTTGHFDRMTIGINRFLEKPLGNGLGEAGPAYRNIHKDLQNTKEIEEYYIPESWFIQQLIEGGFIYFILFVSIFGIILFHLYRASIILFMVLWAILVMNVFLHMFEVTYLTILLALFVGGMYRKEK